MKKIIVFSLMLFVIVNAFAQKGIGFGLKGGLNFANVTGAGSISPSNKSGFHVGVFLSPATKKIMAFRSELLYSDQGYDFKKGNTTGTVGLKYIIIPQLTGINITKYFQLQLGAQMAFLLNATADSTASNGMSGQYGKVMDFYNKLDYGFAVGAEVHPFKGLLIGARYNISLSNLYKMPDGSSSSPSYIPSSSSIDFKNNVVQIFTGWRF